jgi:Bacterial PH domain
MSTHADRRQPTGEYDTEPVRGLPELLPAGEQMLWQGSPDRWSLACQAFHVRKVAIYFAALLVWRVVSSVSDGQTVLAATMGAAHLLVYAAVATAVLGLLAWLTSRVTVYTITNRRIVLRIGIALPMTINVPFRLVESASVKVFADGTGSIPIRLQPPDRIAFLVLWPHCKPWQISRPEPMLRCVPNAASVAQTLSRALAAAAGAPARPLPPEAHAAAEAAGSLSTAVA